MAGLKLQKEPSLRLTALFSIVVLIVTASSWAAPSKAAPSAPEIAPATPPKSDSAKSGTGTPAPEAAQRDAGSASAKALHEPPHPSAIADTAGSSGKSDSAKSA